MDVIGSTRCALQELAAGFDPRALSHDDAARVVGELGAIRRVVEGMLARAAQR